MASVFAEATPDRSQGSAKMPRGLPRGASLPGIEVAHLSELGASDLDDGAIRKRWAEEFVVWVTRDEDFWMDAPSQWAIVWVNCHNPSLKFLKTSIAQLIAAGVSGLRPGSRLLISEDMAVTL